MEKAKQTITAQGRLEPANATYVTNEASNPMKVLSILPDGEFVKEGTVVCELDSKELQSRLAAQKLVADAARFPLDDVRLDLNATEAALAEYQDGALPAERKAILAEIKLAESSLQRSTARLEQLRAGLEKIGALPQADANTAQSRSDALALLDLKDRADALEQAIANDRGVIESKKDALEKLDKITAAKIIRELQTEIARKRLIVRRESKKTDQELERVQDLERQIESCKLRAPRDGTIVREGPFDFGLRVAQGQRIFGIAHVGTPWILNASFGPRSHMAGTHLKIGQEAEVRFADTLKSERYEGEITKIVGTGPQPNRVVLRLNRLPKELSANRSATATFQTESETLMIIPTKATVTEGSETFVAVKGPNGRFEKRLVSVEGGDPLTSYVTGLKAGEEIAKRPASILLNLDGKEDHPQDAPEKKAETPPE